MTKYLILLPHVLEQIKAEYFIQHKQEHEDIKDFLQRLFNPNNRGILTSQVGNEKDQTKVWSEHFSFTCVNAAEGESIKAINIRPTKPFQFHYILEKGYLIEGPWAFSSIQEVRHVQHSTNEDELSAKIEEVQQTLLKEQEFAEFEEYWNQLDIVNTYMAQSIQEQRDKSISKYRKLQVDFDKNSLIIKLESTFWNFSPGERIRICTKEAWNKHMNLNNKDINRVPSMGLGYVTKYRDNGHLVVEAYSTDMLNKVFKEADLKSGYLWVDDVGEKAIIARQKEALHILFNKESANPDLKEFVPDANMLLPRPNLSRWNGSGTTLTGAQKEAIQGALSGNDVYMIQGPPGTGKTTVISEIIRTLAKENKKVLLSSQTHLAVDNVLQRIGEEKDIRAIRIGKEEKIELDCEKFSLPNRVSSLQEEVIQTVLDREAEADHISVELEDTKQLLDAHQKMQKEVKYIVNLVQKIISKSVEKESLTSEIYNQQLLLKELETETIEFHSRFEGRLSEFEAIFEQVENSKSTQAEIVEQAILSCHLDIKDEDVYSLSIYQDILEEWKRLKEEDQSIENQVNQLSQQKRKLEHRLQEETNTYNRLVSFESSSNHDQIMEKEQQLEFIRFELNEIIFRATGLLKERNNGHEMMTSLFKEAEAQQSIIEDYIDGHQKLWIEMFGKKALKKSEFIECFKKKQQFDKEFSKSPEDIDLFLNIEGYTGYIDSMGKKQEIQASFDKLQVDHRKIEKYISKFEGSLESYRLDQQISLYLHHYEISFEHLEVNKELSRIMEFQKQYKDKEHKVQLIQQTKQLRSEWTSQLKFYQESFEDVYIKLSNLICATCLGISSSQNNHFHRTEFDYVIIDEAARSSTLELLIPMVRGKKIILVGDHKQISPQIDRDIMKRMENDYDFSAGDMNALFKDSLFGLMYDRIDDELKTFLNEQFRMHEQISNIVSTYFYDKKLKNGYNVINKTHSLEDKLGSSIYWVKTQNGEYYQEQRPKNGTSYWNDGELDVTKSILTWLDEHLRTKKTVGIIAPYSEQKRRLLEETSGLHFQNLDIEINTVDAFQGREKNIIIMNIVRNNGNHSVGHTANYARINVALSRAQELMFLVGNEDFIVSNQSKAAKLYQVLQHLKRKNSLLDDMFFSSVTSTTEKI
ncbi:AAA domain-containing protein [Bacillus infantis]|uniref:DEAD/DEAH box helicase n=1 Tax=Bacillus infantis TaxID=324767 RepID=UPI00344C97C4